MRSTRISDAVNADAKRFFEQNLTEPYWYYSDTLRVPNPQLKPWELDTPVPWRRPS